MTSRECEGEDRREQNCNHIPGKGGDGASLSARLFFLSSDMLLQVSEGECFF